MKCRHCQKEKANRPRGLCWDCYYRPGVRDQYVAHPCHRRGVAAGENPAGTLPAETTDTRPGSEERIAVLEQRAARGESLFHPGDCNLEGITT